MASDSLGPITGFIKSQIKSNIPDYLFSSWAKTPKKTKNMVTIERFFIFFINLFS